MIMVKSNSLVLAITLFACLIRPLATPLNGKINLTFPLTTIKLENAYIDARLYEYDPLLADAPATLLDQVELEGINFSATSDSLIDIQFSATRKVRMKYYVTTRTYSKKGGALWFYINGFQKIFDQKNTEEINVTMTSKLTTKTPEGEPVKINIKKIGKIHGAHRAMEIVWEGTNGAEFTLQKSSDLKNWQTVDTISGTGKRTSIFLRISGRVQFWRLQPY